MIFNLKYLSQQQNKIGGVKFPTTHLKKRNMLTEKERTYDFGEFGKYIEPEDGVRIVKKKSIYQGGPLGKFFRFRVKPLVKKILGMLCDQIPEPRKDNSYYKNQHALIDLRDEFVSHDINHVNDKLFKGFFNFVIALYFDHYWRERIDLAVKRIKEMDWEIISGEEEPRHKWWLQEGEMAEYRDETASDMLKKELWYAHQDNDEGRIRRMKIIQNKVEGL